jgi:hypothetical protein
MTEGTEDAETQEPSIYKDFGQKVQLVRSQSGKTCSSVQQALIDFTANEEKPLRSSFEFLNGPVHSKTPLNGTFRGV